MAKKKTAVLGRIGVLFLFGLHCGLILVTLYFVWIFGYRHLVAPLEGTWSGIGETPLQVKMYWGIMIFLIFCGVFFIYKVFHSVRKLF